MSRILCVCLGWLMLALGIIGVVLPLMPTTIFLILAVWFFARSSPRLEAWLLGHPRFGPPLVAWRAAGAVPRRAKVAACLGMTIGFALFWIGAHPEPWLTALVAALLLASALFVVTRPASHALAVDRTQRPPHWRVPLSPQRKT